ncbi:unnamed protein product, partial [Amoebophrya sp. A25]
PRSRSRHPTNKNRSSSPTSRSPKRSYNSPNMKGTRTSASSTYTALHFGHRRSLAASVREKCGAPLHNYEGFGSDLLGDTRSFSQWLRDTAW